MRPFGLMDAFINQENAYTMLTMAMPLCLDFTVYICIPLDKKVSFIMSCTFHVYMQHFNKYFHCLFVRIIVIK